MQPFKSSIRIRNEICKKIAMSSKKKEVVKSIKHHVMFLDESAVRANRFYM